MFYYSPEFGAVTDDIEGYISSLVAYTNYAYLNSEVNLSPLFQPAESLETVQPFSL